MTGFKRACLTSDQTVTFSFFFVELMLQSKTDGQQYPEMDGEKSGDVKTILIRKKVASVCILWSFPHYLPILRTLWWTRAFAATVSAMLKKVKLTPIVSQLNHKSTAIQRKELVEQSLIEHMHESSTDYRRTIMNNYSKMHLRC